MFKVSAAFNVQAGRTIIRQVFQNLGEMSVSFGKPALADDIGYLYVQDPDGLITGYRFLEFIYYYKGDVIWDKTLEFNSAYHKLEPKERILKWNSRRPQTDDSGAYGRFLNVYE